MIPAELRSVNRRLLKIHNMERESPLERIEAGKDFTMMMRCADVVIMVRRSLYYSLQYGVGVLISGLDEVHIRKEA